MQRLQGIRRIVSWATENPRELKRQLREFEENLWTLAGELLGLVDGTGTTPVELPLRRLLEIRGNVTLQTAVDRTILWIRALGRGVDGVSVEGDVARASRAAVSLSLSTGTYTAAPAGWQTADILRLTSTGTVSLAGLQAPTTSEDTREKIIFAVSGTAQLLHQSGSATAANRIITPDGLTYALREGSGVRVLYDPTTTRWRVQSKSWASEISAAIGAIPTPTNNHSALSNLNAPNDHPSYLMHNGTRALTGIWSLGNQILTNASQIYFSGASRHITGLYNLVFQSSNSTIENLWVLNQKALNGLAYNGPFVDDTNTLALQGSDGHAHGSHRVVASGSLVRFPARRLRITGMSAGATISQGINLTQLILSEGFSGVPIYLDATLFSYRVSVSAYSAQYARAKFMLLRLPSGNIQVLPIEHRDAITGNIVSSFESNTNTVNQITCTAASNTIVIVTGLTTGVGNDRQAELWIELSCPRRMG